MHLEVSHPKGQGFVEVATHHKGNIRIWPTMAYVKVKLVHPEKIFDELNEFLAWLPMESQDVIWDSYIKIKEILDLVADNIHIGNTIRYYVTEMYKAAPMDQFHKWILTKSNLYYPSDIVDSLAEDSRHQETNQTYLRPAYTNLATLSMAVRLMVPIWGQFLNMASENDHKEMEAVGMLDNTDLMTWPPEEPAWEKMANYVKFFSNDPSAVLNHIWKGFGTEEIPDHLHAKAVVRRLTIVPLTDRQSISVIANVYRYVKSNTKPQDRTTQDRVNKKRPDESSGGEDDDKISIAESYKLKQKVSDGDSVLFDTDTTKMIKLCRKVDPTIPDELVVACTLPDNLNRVALIGEVHTHQKRLCQWVMAKAYSTRAIHLIEDRSVYRLFGCTQALLWHWGFIELAALMQVELLQQSEQLNLTAPKQAKSGARISGKYKEELSILYPYVKPQRAKASDPDPDSNFQNLAAVAINNLTAEIRSSNWQYHGPQPLRALSGVPEGLDVVVISQNIKNTITELVIHLAQINK